MTNNINDLKNELDKMHASFADNASESNGEGFYSAARKWMIQNGIMTDYEYNDLILLSYMADKSVKHVEFFVDKNGKKLHHVVYLSRLGFLFKSREKLESKIWNLIGHLIKDYEYELYVELFTNKIKN